VQCGPRLLQTPGKPKIHNQLADTEKSVRSRLEQFSVPNNRLNQEVKLFANHPLEADS